MEHEAPGDTAVGWRVIGRRGTRRGVVGAAASQLLAGENSRLGKTWRRSSDWKSVGKVENGSDMVYNTIAMGTRHFRLDQSLVKLA